MVASYHDCVLLSKLKGFDITKCLYTSYNTKQAGVSIHYYEYHDLDKLTMRIVCKLGDNNHFCYLFTK